MSVDDGPIVSNRESGDLRPALAVGIDLVYYICGTLFTSTTEEAMKIRSLPLALAALLATSALHAAEPPKGSPEQRQAIQDIRNVGTAMWQWYQEVQVPRVTQVTAPDPEPKQADLAAVPVLSAEELSRVLVPKYIQQIPVNDPWGHPYEYRLNTTDPNALHAMALRSTGRDGVAAGTVYPIGGFLPDDLDQDVVWIDGYFARWPEAPKAGR
jgi:hypothetical protein